MTVKTYGWRLLAVLPVFPVAAAIDRLIPELMIAGLDATRATAILLSLLLTKRLVLAARYYPMAVSLCLAVLVLLFLPESSTRSYIGGRAGSTSISKIQKAPFLSMQSLSALQSFLFDTKAEKVMRQLRAAIHPSDPVVRNFAVRESTRYFTHAYSSYGPLVRHLSLFKSINQQYSYVPDPVSAEYYATAAETIGNGLAGDCDDHTILMTAALKAIGADVRVVLIEDHVYPELYAGDELAFMQVKKTIAELFPEARPNGMYYRLENGKYWINLDYTATYPGGPYTEGKLYAMELF
jgi:transglutaminase-like putative cysteine protease